MIAYFIGVIGMGVLCDGLASLWAYLPNKKETFWRNHSFRILRTVYGIALMVLGGDVTMKKKQIINCYRCSHYLVCFLRIGIDHLLDEGHHKQVSGGKSVLENSIALPFFELLAKICKGKFEIERDIEL